MKPTKQITAAVLAVLLAVGCTPKTQLVYVPTPAPIAHPAAPSAPVVEDVRWQVWNKEAARQAAIEPGADRVWYVLDPDQFKSLIDTLAGTSGFIDKQGNLLKYYKDAIDAHNANVAEQQKQAERR